MNKYLVTAVIVLSLMVLDQVHALHQLSEINRLLESTVNDYYATIQNGCK